MAQELRYDYCSVLNGNSLPSDLLKPEQSPNQGSFSTLNPTYDKEVRNAENRLREYFGSATKDTPPLNCLILGPPGAGKTFLAESLAGAAQVEYDEVNVSLMSDPQELLGQIRKRKDDRPKFLFIDEFDVTIGGSSVTRFLLEPMTNKKECFKTAFVFSGSYLKSKSILNRLNGNLTDFDLTLFLLHLIGRQPNEMLRAQLIQLYEMCCLYQKSRHDLAPDADVLQYLSQLHKLRDFLSRINGFILQIPDIASPMMITDNSLIIDRSLLNSNSSKRLRLRESRTAQAVVEFAKNMEPQMGDQNDRPSFPVFGDPSASLVGFKHMLLLERLRLVLQLLRRRIKQTSKCNHSYFMARQSLNFLAMVPLHHNIRSLRYIIDQCLIERSFWNPHSSEFMQTSLPSCELRLNVESPILDMHIAPEPYFSSPRVLWDFLGTANSAQRTVDNAKEFKPKWLENGDELILIRG